MENINEQTACTEHNASIEQGAEVSLGKFKDVEALLSAYNSLQAEFTKRCQRLKELEGTATADKIKSEDTVHEDEAKTEKVITEEQKNQILVDYLKSVFNSKQKAVLIDGTGIGVKTPAEKPASIAEAGMLAKQIFKS